MKQRLIQLHSNDDIAIAGIDLDPKTDLPGGLRTTGAIPVGHKIALRSVAKGQPVRRYDQIIGLASADITAGDHVHVHNLEMADFERDYAFCENASPTPFEAEPRTFMGIKRADRSRRYLQLYWCALQSRDSPFPCGS